MKIDFISFSLKPDRGNQVIYSPTLLSLLVAALVPSGCKIQPAEKQMHLKSWADHSSPITADLHAGMDRVCKEGLKQGRNVKV